MRRRLDGVAEKHDARLHRTAAASRASRHDEIVNRGRRVRELDVAVRPSLVNTVNTFFVRVPFARVDRLCEARVQSSQLLLEPSPVAHVAARDADSFVRRPVKLERVFAPGGVVQPVDVLRDEAPDLAVPLRVR